MVLCKPDSLKSQWDSISWLGKQKEISSQLIWYENGAEALSLAECV